VGCGIDEENPGFGVSKSGKIEGKVTIQFLRGLYEIFLRGNRSTFERITVHFLSQNVSIEFFGGMAPLFCRTPDLLFLDSP
jgi:hypothetical protein